MGFASPYHISYTSNRSLSICQDMFTAIVAAAISQQVIARGPETQRVPAPFTSGK
jgi:hypothetical protein